MRYILLAVLLAVTGFSLAGTLDSYLSFSYEGDSLGFGSGRRRANLGFRYDGGAWNLEVDESFISSDSGGIVPRYLRCTSETDIDLRVVTSIFLFNPDFRYCFDPDEGAEQILPVTAGVALRKGYMRPGMALGIDLPGNLYLDAHGHYWNRDIESDEGAEIAWTEIRYGGGLTWETPWGFNLSTSGLKHSTSAGDIAYEPEWTRVDVAVSTAPRQFPTMTSVVAEMKYSIFDGEDFLNNPLADRVTARIRAVQNISPELALNMTVTTVFDLEEGLTRTAANKGAVRLIYHFLKSGDVPSSLSLGGQYTTSSIETSRLDLAFRINVWKGLSVLLNTDLWEGPTSVPGASASRQKVTLGAGLEYRLTNSFLVWATVEQERTDFSEIEVWERIRTGLEFYPGRFSF